MKIEDIRKKTNKELQKLLAEQRDELREVRFKVASRQFKNYKKVNQIKRDIAKVLTVFKEKSSVNNLSNKDKS